MVNIKEVEKYLGYPTGADQKTYDLIESLSKEMQSSIKGKFVYKSFDIEKITSDYVKLSDPTITLKGKSIANHLKDCSSVFIFACTLGAKADQLIQLKSHLSALSGLIADAIASDLVMQYCNQCEELIRETLQLGYSLTSRFSPGYGDFSLEVQSLILAALQAHKRIGLTLNESFLLIPLKSVVAIVGVSDKNFRLQTLNRCGNISCRVCEYSETCQFKKEFTIRK